MSKIQIPEGTPAALAQMVLEVARIRESSFLSEKFEKEKSLPFIHEEDFYGVTLRQACEQVSPELSGLIYLAVSSWWNDSIDWANQTLGIKNNEESGYEIPVERNH